MSYGADQRESINRAAALVDSIFKCTRPGDLPVEQPTRYLFVMNPKTAKGNTLVALADEVME
jgi:putative ABC transport system substrate-binding protein